MRQCPDFRYRLFGALLACDVPLELPRAAMDDTVNVVIRAADAPFGELPKVSVIQEDFDDWTHLKALSDGSVLVEWKDWLTFHVSTGGREVRYQVREETYPTAFEAYVANFALSSALLLQGEEMLHSTVVAFGGICVGFLGISGAGKSTLTAHLLAQGGELVTDDMLRISGSGPDQYAEPGQPRLKLFEETAEKHFPGGINRGRWNPLSEKYLFDLADPALPRPRVRLDALVWLAEASPDTPDAVAIERLSGLELFQTIAGSTMNYRLQLPDRLARQFAFARKVAASLPVYVLRYPRRHDVFPEVVAALEGAIRPGAGKR